MSDARKSEREFLHGEFYWAEVSHNSWEPIQYWEKGEAGMFYQAGNRYLKPKEDYLNIGERIEKPDPATERENTVKLLGDFIDFFHGTPHTDIAKKRIAEQFLNQMKAE